MFNWLRRRFGHKIISWIEKPEGLPLAKFGDYDSYIKAGTGKIWATWKAIDLIAQAVADTPYLFYRKGTNTKTEPPDLVKLFGVPNQFETMAELLYKLIFHVRLTGNAYMVKDEPDVKFNRPKQLFLLNPKLVKIVPDKQNKIRGYLWNAAPGTEIPFEPEEIIHFKRPHPDSDYFGIGDMEAGEELFKEFLNRSSWGQGFWKNGAAPSAVMILEDQVTDEVQFEKAKAQFNKQYAGVKNSGKTLLLTGKWKYEKVGLTPYEMESLESSKFSIETIFHLHGVPLSIAGIKEADSEASARVDDIIFRRQAVKPMVGMIRDTLQSDLVDGYNANVTLSFALAGLMNIAEIVADFGPLFDRGIISINEMREKVGLEPDLDNPLFDQHFINAGLMPLELAGLANQQATDAAAAAVTQRFISQALERKRIPAHANGAP